ncbi:MAG: GNAT family N-acetyltransferase [Verrucomicrobia bacterium]|nr:GNAT family N-acetyltransferase [Kiritimatiellia bacterium]MCO6401042.1 GNAT family N-acetyltransferase [Verrucomicrobiota bacterium]
MALRDLSDVYELGAQLFTAEKWPTLYRAWDEHEILNLFNSESEYCLVAECDEVIVGFALGTMMRKPRNSWSYGWLLWLGVSPRFKRRGLGGRLINKLTDTFIDDGARMMLVDTDAQNKTALGLFRKMGFADEMNHVYLSKNLHAHPRYIERTLDEEEWEDEIG